MTSDLLTPAECVPAVSRRDALRRAGLAFGAIAALPVLGAGKASAQTAPNPNDTVSILNFALTLEYLDGLFYERGLATPNLIPANDRDFWTQLVANEQGHRAALSSRIRQLGGTPVSFTFENFNYQALGFDPFSSYELFADLSQGFEDLGQRAYKGQAPQPAIMMNDVVLTEALQIHSVEARHASVIRRIRGREGWITLNQTDAPIPAAIYAGDENLTQGSVNVGTLAVTPLTIDAATRSEAFDEPLTADQVLAIARPFIRS
ncbi:MAG TPA: ferritin-like domain-containing protein [Rubricoccaceae bacterium]|jgi:hypothetical protein